MSAEEAWHVAGFGWVLRAACAKELGTQFFPDRGEPTDAAKAVCGRCPVSRPCLAYAIRHRITDGVWGGLSPQERRKLQPPSPSSEETQR